MTKLKDMIEGTGALAKAKAVRSSARKLNLVAASIRGKTAAAALTQLNFERRRTAHDVKRVLMAAVANAENNHGLDVDKLYVAEAFVGRAFVLKRFSARARGRSSGIEKPYSNLTIVVKERENDSAMSAKRARAFSKKKTTEGSAKAAAGAGA